MTRMELLRTTPIRQLPEMTPFAALLINRFAFFTYMLWLVILGSQAIKCSRAPSAEMGAE